MTTRMVASFLGVLSVMAVLVSAMRAPDAVLRIAFAHACATANHVDTELVDRKDDHTGDVQALTRSAETAKISTEQQATDFTVGAAAFSDEMSAAFWSVGVVTGDVDAIAYRVEPPSRARARLMVFLI